MNRPILWLTTIGMLPDATRELIGVSWSRKQNAQLSVIASSTRLLGTIPARWRYLEPARDAYNRRQSSASRPVDTGGTSVAA